MCPLAPAGSGCPNIIPDAAPSLNHSRAQAHRAALDAAAAGRAVFPLQGKKPTTGATPNGFENASRDPARISAMFNAAKDKATGYGIATGKLSGVIVVDIDGPEGRAEAERRGLRSGYVVKTGRPDGDGWHVYLRLPPGVVLRSCDLAPGLELKAEGKYVVGPGSLHPSGRMYRVAKDGQPSAAPQWVVEAGAKRTAERGPADRGEAVTIDLAGPPILEGARNVTLTRIAGRLHDGTRGLEQLRTDLLAVNEARCTPQLPESEVRAIAESIARRDPCKRRPEVSPRVLAAVDYLASVERPVRGMGGATGWSIYRAGLELLRRYGKEQPDGLELSVDVRTWAQMAGTTHTSVRRFIGRTQLVRVLRKGSGRRSGAFVFAVPAKGHKAFHSSSGGVGIEREGPRSGTPSALLRTLERLRWGPGRIGKSRAAILHKLVECGEPLSRAEIAARLGRKAASLRAPLRWLVEAGLLERVGHGVYGLPGDVARRVDDARELAGEPEADRLQIERHAREREGYRNRRERRVESKPTPAGLAAIERSHRRRKAEMPKVGGTIAELERLPGPARPAREPAAYAGPNERMFQERRPWEMEL